MFLTRVGPMNDRKFIAAKPDHVIGVIGQLPQSFSDSLQQRIANRMAERVVHFFEAVKIKQENREPTPMTAYFCQCLACPFHEQRAIGEASQGVVARHARQLS